MGQVGNSMSKSSAASSHIILEYRHCSVKLIEPESERLPSQSFYRAVAMKLEKRTHISRVEP